MISTELNTIFKSSSFFQPNQEMLEWIVKYADGRPIIDCGCGNGEFSIALRKAGQGPIIAMDFICCKTQRSNYKHIKTNRMDKKIKNMNSNFLF